MKGSTGEWRVAACRCWGFEAQLLAGQGLEDLQSCCLDASPVQTPLAVSSFLQTGLLAPRAT